MIHDDLFVMNAENATSQQQIPHIRALTTPYVTVSILRQRITPCNPSLYYESATHAYFYTVLKKLW